MFSTGNISPNYSVTIDSTPPRPQDPYEAFLCDDLRRAHYGTSSHVEAISHPATLRGQRQDVYSKTVKSSCSPATQGSTITGRCRRFEGRVRSQSLELTRGEENHPCSSYSYRTNAASIMDNRVRPVALESIVKRSAYRGRMWGKVFRFWGEILPPSEYIATYLGTHIGGCIRKVSV